MYDIDRRGSLWKQTNNSTISNAELVSDIITCKYVKIAIWFVCFESYYIKRSIEIINIYNTTLHYNYITFKLMFTVILFLLLIYAYVKFL